MSEQYDAGCRGKHPYRSRRTAESVAKRQRRKHGESIAVYRCEGHWHVGQSNRDADSHPPREKPCACRRCPCSRIAESPHACCSRCRHGRHETVPRGTEEAA